jgi:uncharacterized membrane protein YhaH (DUF805 family)
MKAPEMPTLKSSPPMSERPSTGARGTSDVEQSGIGWLYFSTRGRLGRMNYFLSALLLAAIGIGLNLIVQQVFYGRISFEPSPNYMAGTFAAFILNLWPSIALGAKRFHDQDRSGHFLWLFFIPLANLAAGIMLLFVPGTAGPNRFGSPRE